MKFKILFISILTSCFAANAQQVSNGPELNNENDVKMNRMINGDDNSFYCYRVKSKGKETAHFIEKYDKTSMNLIFSKEMPIDQGRFIRIQDIEYAADNVCIFIKDFSKETKEMHLYCQMISSNGTISNQKQEIATAGADYYEFVDVEIVSNPGKTKFLVKLSHKQSLTDAYKTDFVLLDAKTIKPIWVKHIFYSSCNGLMLDDADNVIYAHNAAYDSGNNKLTVGILSAKAENEDLVALPFDNNYYFSNIKFSIIPNTEIAVGGYIKSTMNPDDKEMPKIGIFNFKISLINNSVVSKAINMFDDKLLTAMGFNPRQQYFFKYKLDYVYTIDKEIYYVGQQYRENSSSPGNGMQQIGSAGNSSYNGQLGFAGEGTGGSTAWLYGYMDVIVAKVNAAGEFEWIKSTPSRINFTVNYFPHLYKQYIAAITNNNIYILFNENKKNMELFSSPDFQPKDLKKISADNPEGTNFVSYSVSCTDGSINHKLIFENKDYYFSPIQEVKAHFSPPASIDLFVKGKDNGIYIYTNNGEKDRFSTITFK